MIRIIFSLWLLSATVLADIWQTYRTDNSGLISNNVRVIVIDDQGNKWFGTDQGLSFLSGSGWISMTIEDGLVNNHIRDMAIEWRASDYLLWIATDGGITKLRVSPEEKIFVDTSFTTQNSAILADQISAVAIDPNQVKWFGTNLGVSIFDGQIWRQATEADYLLSNSINDLASDEDGLVHIATKGGGVSRLKLELDGITAATTIVSGWGWLLNDTVNSVYTQAGGIQWYGTGDGVFRHVGRSAMTNWRVYRETNGLISNFVRPISGDSINHMWFGTNIGISSLTGDTFKNYTMQDGVASNYINSIAADVNGDIWIGTENGVSRFHYDATGIRDESIPQDFTLTNYPNPFNNGTIISFYLPHPAKAGLSIYNILGENVYAVPDQFFSQGIHHLAWQGTDKSRRQLPSGIYFAVLSYDQNFLTRKVMLLK